MESENQNIKRPSLKQRLLTLAIEVLRANGWTVSSRSILGKSSMRSILKNGKDYKLTIRTSQNTYIAFNRDVNNTCWETLCEADFVMAASVDPKDRRYARFHLIPASDVTKHFDEALAARKAAGRKVSLGHGLWIGLYSNPNSKDVMSIGGGLGKKFPSLDRLPLGDFSGSDDEEQEGDVEVGESADLEAAAALDPSDGAPITIREAKRLLGIALGVSPSCIKISIKA